MNSDGNSRLISCQSPDTLGQLSQFVNIVTGTPADQLPQQSSTPSDEKQRQKICFITAFLKIFLAATHAHAETHITSALPRMIKP